MPIDPNIALGVRPVEQVNMLGQMGQMMALRSAQQEYEGQNALRDAFASGGSLSDPAFVQRLRAANPKMAFDFESKYLAGEKTRSELLGNAYKNSREALTMVNSPESLRAYTVSQFSDPVMGPALKARGLTPEIALANLDKEISTSGFNTVLKKSAMGLDSFFKDETSRANAATAAAPGHRQASVAEQRFKNELDFGGETKPFLIQDPNDPSRTIEVEHRRDKRTGQWVPMAIQPPPLSVNVSPSSATAAPIAPVVGGGGGGGGVVNNLTPNAINAPNVNALNPNTPVVAANVPNPALAVVRGGAPTLTEVANPNNPMETMRVDARVYKGGGPDAPGVLGIVKTGNLNPAQQLKVKTEMAKDFKAVDKTIAETNELLKSIDAVRNSNLERVAGPIDARTFTMTDEGKMAETRFESLKGKVTAIAKAASTMTGAIGSIANQEWQILANQIAVLDLRNGKDPSLEQINQLERQALSIANRMREGFSRQYGEYIDELGPQYREIPDVTYKMGSEGFTPKGQKRPAQSSATPAGTGNITDNAGVAKVINFEDMPK